MKHTIEEVSNLVVTALERAGASHAMAAATARSLVAAEMAGLGGHGLSRVALYAQHVKEGRASGTQEPRIVREKSAACLIDAQGALAYLAMELATKEAARRARESGVAFIAAGHHATERYGAPAVAAHVAAELGLSHQFIDIHNPA